MPQAGGNLERAMFDVHYFGTFSTGGNETGARANRGWPGDFAKWRKFIVAVEQ
jgi:hypothetical protein